LRRHQDEITDSKTNVLDGKLQLFEVGLSVGLGKREVNDRDSVKISFGYALDGHGAIVNPDKKKCLLAI
jgi:hypothetical protein